LITKPVDIWTRFTSHENKSDPKKKNPASAWIFTVWLQTRGERPDELLGFLEFLYKSGAVP